MCNPKDGEGQLGKYAWLGHSFFIVSFHEPTIRSFFLVGEYLIG
jgi:hypothetical protein